MMANSAVPGDSAVAPVSTGPSTKRSRVSRKAKAPTAVKTRTAQGAAKALAGIKGDAKSLRLDAKPLKPRTKTKARSRGEAPERRTSDVLRQILADNPQDKISVEQILKGLGTTSFGTSMLVF